MTTPRHSVVLIGLAILIFAVHGVTAANLKEVGTLMNGPSFDLVESGGYLYAAQGSEVRVYDVSTAAKMSALTWKDAIATVPVGSAVYGLEINSGYLYIASADRFVIADLKKPDAPVIAGSLANPYPGTQSHDVIINGNTAYLMIDGAGILVIDITDKTAPRSITRVNLNGSNEPWRATLSGSNLYVGSSGDDRLSILDVSNPTKPVITGSYSHSTSGSNSISGVAVKGNYAYISEYYNGVRVIDVSNPAKPVEVGSLMSINANDIKILGNYAYLSVRYQGFDIIDISDPKNIKIVGKASDVPCYEEGIYPVNGYTFLAIESQGIGIYDTSDVTRPVTLSRVNVIGGSDSLAVQGNYLYIGGHNDGVWVVDITNRAQPKEVAFLNNDGRNVAVQVQANKLYVAGDWEGIDVVDVTNPQNPKFAVRHFSENLYDVLPDGNYVYTDEGIADFSNMASPKYVAKSAYFHGRMAKYGDKYLLVADSDGTHNGVNVIDISDKKNPVTVTTFDPGHGYTDICVSGTTAVALMDNSVVTIDMSNPSAPVELNRVNYPGSWTGYALTANGTIVYAVGYGSGQVKAFDVSNPAKITLVDSVSTNSVEQLFTVVQTDGYIYAGEKMGVHIFSSSLIPQKINHAPVLSEIGNKTVSANNRLEFSISATDIDGDPLMYAASGLPVNATFDANSRTFTWVPGEDQVGSSMVTFTASDGILSDAETITITVVAGNHAPVMAAIPAETIKPDTLLSFAVTATDMDGDKLTYSASGLPYNASFDQKSGTFSWVPNATQVGSYTVTFTVTDGSLSDSKTTAISVASDNHAPVMAAISAETVKPETLLTFPVTATDPDNDPLTYSASGMPYNASFDPKIRAFSWIPNATQIGSYTVKFTVTDGSLYDSKTAAISVSDANQAPVMAKIPPSTVKPGTLLRFVVTATDPDGDELTYTASNLPVNASFDTTSRTFSWVPGTDQAGTYSVTFSVSDGVLTDQKNATITVASKTNHAPVLGKIPDKSIRQGSRIFFIVTATDADRDRLVYSASNLPAGAVFDTKSRTFSWTPASGQIGNYRVTFSVSDGMASDTENVPITVTSPPRINHAPVLAKIPAQYAWPGTKVSFMVSGTDPDRDALTYTASNLPAGATFAPDTRTFTWTPGSAQAGVFSVTFNVSDGNLTSSRMATITVFGENAQGRPSKHMSGGDSDSSRKQYFIKLE